MNQEFKSKDQANAKINKYDNDKLLEVGKTFVNGVEGILHKAFSQYEEHMKDKYPNKKSY